MILNIDIRLDRYIILSSTLNISQSIRNRMRKFVTLIVLLVIALALPLTQPSALADTEVGDTPLCTQVLNRFKNWESSRSTLEISSVSANPPKIEGTWKIGSSTAPLIGYYVPNPTKSCNPFPYPGFSPNPYKCLDQCNIGFAVYWQSCQDTKTCWQDKEPTSPLKQIGLEYDGTVMTYAGSIQGLNNKPMSQATNYKMRLVISTVTQDRENVRNVGISSTTLRPPKAQ